VILNPVPMLLYRLLSICILHFTTSKGVTLVWVGPAL